MQTQTINISLPQQLVKIMDNIAVRQFSSRSDLIRTAVLDYINRQEKWSKLFTYGKGLAKRNKFSEKVVEKTIDDYRINF